MTLVFSTAVVGDFVQRFQSSFSRLTPIAERQNFWCNTVILDGRFPAQVWRHEFVLYNEEATRGQLAEWLYNLEALITSDAATLTLISSVTTPTGFSQMNYGACYLEDATQEDPRDLGEFWAGYFRLTFVGNTRPTRTA